MEGDVSGPWLGFLVVAVVLFLFGAIAGLMAARFFKRGAPPTPQMAIDEGKLIKETVTSSHPATIQGPRDVTSPREEVRS
jgi:Putative Actinobacterial Holin-X, holin superfamily III